MGTGDDPPSLCFRLLSRGENFPLFRGPEEQRRYRELFDIFMTSLLKIGIDQQVWDELDCIAE